MHTADKQLLDKQYQTKLKAYKAETNPLRKRQLKEEGTDLRIRLGKPHPKGGCYTCGDTVLAESNLFPFCSSPCHDRWGRLNDLTGLTHSGEIDIDIRKRQQRALALAAEIRAKKEAV